jgi:hypothetical protein
MDAAQIDQTLEKLMVELQHFKSASDLLTHARIKSEQVIAAAEAIVRLAEQIRNDNQRQVETMRNYTASSEQGLAALAASVTNAQSHQYETLLAFEQAARQNIEALVASVTSAQKQQEEAIEKLERSIQEIMQSQDKAQRQRTWILFAFVLITLLVAGASLWLLLVSARVV